jgi:hypothetical protein
MIAKSGYALLRLGNFGVNIMPQRLLRTWIWVFGFFLLGIVFLWPRLQASSYGIAWRPAHFASDARPASETTTNHTIDQLIRDAESRHEELLSKETFGLDEAAEAYRARRKRHPPPGFDAWYKFATKNRAIIIEDFWDQIYEDLTPFWGLTPAEIRLAARSNANNGGESLVTIRPGNVSFTKDGFWRTGTWQNFTATLVQQTEKDFEWPSLNLRLNTMDESRLSVPWEDMSELVKKSNENRRMLPSHEVKAQFSTADPEIDTLLTEESQWESARKLQHHHLLIFAN